MKDRLTDIVKDSLIRHIDNMDSLAENLVNDLLANGVLAPPCRVGQTVYIIDEPDFEDPYVLDVKVNAIGQDEGGVWVTLDLPLGFKQSQYIGACSIGRTVFLTDEDAEKALKERES